MFHWRVFAVQRPSELTQIAVIPDSVSINYYKSKHGLGLLASR